MHTKFDSIYFAVDKNQTLGPQDRSFAWADEKFNKSNVTYISGVSGDGKTSYYEFASHKDLPTFLKAYSKIPDKEKCFNEQIREGYACSEYYDIDWTLKPSVKDPEEIVQLEQRVFEEFLQQRNQYAPEYPVSKDQCRVLSSSSSTKVSLHIVIPTYTFKNNNQHMLKFMQDFKTARSKQDQDENSLGDHIDMGVYSKNRSIRCLGSCKRNDMSRRFIRAPWHQSSVQALDAEFFITSVRPDSTEVVCQTVANRRSQRQPNQTPQSSTTSGGVSPSPQLSLSQAVADAIQGIFVQYKHASQYKMIKYSGGMTFKLKRDCAGQCDVCKRIHDRDNAFLKLGTAGGIYLHCHRSGGTGAAVEIGKLDFCQTIEAMARLPLGDPSVILNADTTYNERYVKHTYLSPPKLSHRKSNIVQKQPPSLMIRSDTGTGKTVFEEELVKANKGSKFVAVTCR
ncbi:hypothetical protein BGZ49_008891 [Haplosporangium sp. Z 27]|nr:hypothetical protein BGZ49_008891 [Haplosporangium sp. Z 27]